MPQRIDWSLVSAAALSSLFLASIFVSQESANNARLPNAGRINNSKENATQVTKAVVPGIRNTGNTCFMNALLQALAASPSMCKHMQDVDSLLEAEVLYSGTASVSADSFSRALCETLHDLQVRDVKVTSEESVVANVITKIGNAWKQSATVSPIVLDLSNLEKKLRYISRTFAKPHEQQDADELLTITLDVLEKEAKKAWRILAPTLRSQGLNSLLTEDLKEDSGKNAHEELAKENNRWWQSNNGASNINNSSIISRTRGLGASRAPLRTPLEGTLLSLMQCTKCGRKSPLRPTPFNVLSIPIPGKSSRVQDCLREFVKYELVDGVECSRCAAIPGRSPKQQARKRLMIGRLPGVLCLRLQRNLFDVRAGYMYKDQSLVAIPKILDASEACFFSVLANEEKNPVHQENSPWKTDLTAGPDATMNPLLFALKGSMPAPLVVPATNAKTPQKKPRDIGTVTVSQFEEKHTSYKLVAIVEHLGTAFGGHYVTYRLIHRDGAEQWMRCSDENVIAVPEKQVLESVQAYMCIYERFQIT